MKLKTMYTTSNFKSWKKKVLAKVKKETTELKQTKPVLSTDFKKHLEEEHPFFLSPLIKHQSNFAFIYTKYYISKLLEVYPNKNTNSVSTISQTQEFKEEVIKTNVKQCKRFFLKITEQGKTFSIMYWLPKMTPIGGTFTVASKNCSAKPLPDVISKVSRMV